MLGLLARSQWQPPLGGGRRRSEVWTCDSAVHEEVASSLASGVLTMPGLIVFSWAVASPHRTASAITRSELPPLSIRRQRRHTLAKRSSDLTSFLLNVTFNELARQRWLHPRSGPGRSPASGTHQGTCAARG